MNKDPIQPETKQQHKQPSLSALGFYKSSLSRMDAWHDLKYATAKLAGAQERGQDTQALRDDVAEMMASRGTYEASWAFPGPTAERPQPRINAAKEEWRHV